MNNLQDKVEFVRADDLSSASESLSSPEDNYKTCALSNARKCCTVCGNFKDLSEYDKNRSKNDGHDSRCKKCVSAIKAGAYKRKKKRNIERTKFCTTLVGLPEETNFQDFARAIGSAMKELLDETEPAETD